MRARGALAAALVLAACHRPSAQPVHPATPVQPPLVDGGSPSPTGVQAALPFEWSLSPAADGSLRAGPRGRGVLRIDVAPPGTPRPSPESLADGFSHGLKGLSATVLRTEEDESFSGVVLSVSHARGDTLTSHPVFLGAKQAASVLYLCASTPGSTLSELSRAASLCRGLAPAKR